MPMMSGISSALQALLTHSQVMEITEHNVANASTPGYRRQSAILTAATPTPIVASEHGLGAGQRGSGVTIERIQRFNLSFFDGRYRAVTADQNNWQSQSEILNQLEPMMAETTEDGLLPKLDQFWTDWSSITSDPTATGLRTVLLEDAASLSLAFNRRANQIMQLRSDQNLAISSQVEEVNTLAGNIADLNAEIMKVLSVGEQPNDLMDKRDLAIDRLSELTGAVSFDQKNGDVLVSVGGHILVTGNEAIQLHTQPNATDTSINDIYWADGQQMIPTNGSLKGVLHVRDTILTGQLSGLNTLAAGLINQVNAIHTTGYGLNNATGLDFFSGTDALSISVNTSLDAASVASSSALDQPGNSNIAAQIAGLKTVKGMKGNTVTLNEFYNAQVTDLGAVIKRATDSARQQGLVSQALGDQRESVAGVNLDEEAANMAKAQKAYQAAARIMTAYDDLLDLVINRMGRVGL